MSRSIVWLAACVVAGCGGAQFTDLLDGGGDGGADSSASDGASTDSGGNADGGGGCTDGGCASFSGSCENTTCAQGSVCVARSVGPQVTRTCYPLPACGCEGQDLCSCIGACACGGAINGGCHDTNGGISCAGPVSRRDQKTDIDYVPDAERARLAREALSIDIAEYRYRSEPADTKRHLGFIIDDLPASSPAVQADEQHVDLYGYTTMLLATVQEQQREIAALQRQVAALQKSKR